MAQTQRSSSVKEKIRISEPRMYRVRMHNDDFTTMDFVVMVLCTVFFKTPDDAENIMLTIHRHGSAIVGTYPLDIALSKARKAKMLATKNGFPLRITLEEE